MEVHYFGLERCAVPVTPAALVELIRSKPPIDEFPKDKLHCMIQTPSTR